MLLTNYFFFTQSVVLSVLLVCHAAHAQKATSQTSIVDTPTACQTFSSNPLSRVNTLTCTQYATAKLTPVQNLIIKDSPTTKNSIAFAPRLAAQRGQISTTLKAHAHVYHPSGSVLFPDSSSLAGAFDGVLATLKNAGAVTNKGQDLSYFIPLFRKFQFMALSDIYRYLTSLYSTFTLMHKNSVYDYLVDEPIEAFNKKSLIVAHLLNVIQAQLFFVCAHHQPLIPQHFGLKAGSLLLQHDMTADPLFLVKDFSKPFFPGDLALPAQKIAHTNLQNMQKTYLQALSTVLNFFRQYTAYLNQPDPTSPIPGSSLFVKYATRIASVMEQDPFKRQASMVAAMSNTNNQETVAKVNALRQVRARFKPINPPLFHYDATVLRALRLIPQLALDIPHNTALIGWPEQLVKSAQAATQATSRGQPIVKQKKVTIKGKPTLEEVTTYTKGRGLGYVIAYFEDAQQQVTTNLSSAVKLFINLPTVNGPYSQEVIKQPAWLNSVDGILNVLGACLGDYSRLVGMNVLSPCVEHILCTAQGLPCAGAALSQCQAQLAFVQSTHNEFIQAATSPASSTQSTTTTTTPPPPQQTTQSGYSSIGQYTSGNQDTTQGGA